MADMGFTWGRMPANLSVSVLPCLLLPMEIENIQGEVSGPLLPHAFTLGS